MKGENGGESEREGKMSVGNKKGRERGEEDEKWKKVGRKIEKKRGGVITRKMKKGNFRDSLVLRDRIREIN